MDWQLALYSLPVFAAAVLTVTLAVSAWRQSTDPIVAPFAVLMLAVHEWTLADAIRIGFASPAEQLFWEQVGFLGASVVPTAWLVLTLFYAGYRAYVTRRVLAVAAVEPAITQILVWTNDAHGLVWKSVTMPATSEIPLVELTFGPWYWVNLAYSYVLVVVGIGLILQVFLTPGRIHRTQSGVLLVGAIAPFGANALFASGLSPIPTLDLTPFAFALTGALFALALFHWELLELAPVARMKLVEEMDDGLLVVDTDGRIVDSNPTARRIVGLRTEAVQPVESVFEDGLPPTGGEFTSVLDGRARTYSVRHTALSDQYGRPAGLLVTFTDVTEIKAREQRLQVINRVLRHNVRNDMNVLLGHLELLDSPEMERSERRSIDIARSKAEQIVDLSDRARDVEQTMQATTEGRTVLDASEAVDKLVSQFEVTYPEASFTTDTTVANVAVVSRRLLDTALSNLLENAIEHNDSETPVVEVTVSDCEDHIQIIVADNGPGIPEIDRSALKSGLETPLRHSSGLGLWLTQWIVSVSGGNLTFGANDSRGTVVTVSLPRPNG